MWGLTRSLRFRMPILRHSRRTYSSMLMGFPLPSGSMVSRRPWSFFIMLGMAWCRISLRLYVTLQIGQPKSSSRWNSNCVPWGINRECMSLGSLIAVGRILCPQTEARVTWGMMARKLLKTLKTNATASSHSDADRIAQSVPSQPLPTNGFRSSIKVH